MGIKIFHGIQFHGAESTHRANVPLQRKFYKKLNNLGLIKSQIMRQHLKNILLEVFFCEQYSVVCTNLMKR